jgi:uncharacterized repeat protein (TIGR01451 family)
MRFAKTILPCALILIVAVGALQVLQVHAADQTVELAYDSGNCSNYWFVTKASGVGTSAAVRFTSPYRVPSILSVKYHIEAGHALGTFNVLILDSDRKPVYEKPANPTTAGWFIVDLSGEGIVVTGDFYVAMKWTTLAPALCADQTNGHGRSFFVASDGTWATYSEQNNGKDGDFMIRALVSNKGTSLTLVDLKTNPGPGEHVYVGDTITATFTLQNTGAATASSVEVRVESPSEVVVLKVTTARDLAPGSSGTWEVVMRPSKEGQFDVLVRFFVNGVQQSFGGVLSGDHIRLTLPVEAKPAFLVLERVETAPSGSEPFYVGDVATITYVVTNGGQIRAENVEVKVVDAPPEIEIEEVTAPKDLQPGTTSEWQVKIKASQPGTYEIYVSFFVKGEKQIFETEGQTGTIDEFKVTISARERPFLDTYGLYVAAGLVVMVVIVALVVARRRKGRAAPPPAGLAPAPPVPPHTITPPPAEGEFCGNCGSKLPTGSAFCPNCGARRP